MTSSRSDRSAAQEPQHTAANQKNRNVSNMPIRAASDHREDSIAETKPTPPWAPDFGFTASGSSSQNRSPRQAAATQPSATHPTIIQTLGDMPDLGKGLESVGVLSISTSDLHTEGADKLKEWLQVMAKQQAAQDDEVTERFKRLEAEVSEFRTSIQQLVGEVAKYRANNQRLTEGINEIKTSLAGTRGTIGDMPNTALLTPTPRWAPKRATTLQDDPAAKDEATKRPRTKL